MADYIDGTPAYDGLYHCSCESFSSGATYHTFHLLIKKGDGFYHYQNGNPYVGKIVKFTKLDETPYLLEKFAQFYGSYREAVTSAGGTPRSVSQFMGMKMSEFMRLYAPNDIVLKYVKS